MSKKFTVLSGALGIVLAATTFAAMPADASVNASKAASAAAFGGFDKLVAAAKKEGTLNIIATPPDWANYGYAFDIMTKAFGIKIVSDSPDASSAFEINAIKTTKNMAKMPDVIDIGIGHAPETTGLLASYRVMNWGDIPKQWKDPKATWYGGYTGSIAMCYDSSVSPAPTSIKSLDNPAYKGMFAIPGDPTAATQGLMSVFAATVANGGSVKNVAPGVAFFHKLKSEGIFLTVTADATSFASGSFKIALMWDYNAPGFIAQAATIGKTVKCAYPSDVNLMGTPYVEAINKTAPHPAAARLWEELIFSEVNGKLAADLSAADLKLKPLELLGTVMGGQNIYRSSGATAITIAAMLKKGTAGALPKGLDTPAGFPASVTPSLVQQATASTYLKTAWPKI